ncbi:hypothetical protein NU195Hw_g3t1 [Hortaea werneckii]
MESHAVDQGKAAMADLMSIAKWKAPHASIGAWQAGLDEIDRFYRSTTSHLPTVPQPQADDAGTMNEYNAGQAGFHGAQSLLGPAHEELPDEMFYPVDYELTMKQNDKSVLQQEQAADSLLQPDSPVPNPPIKLHPPHASSSLNPENTTSLPNLNQPSESTNIEIPPEPFPTPHQPPPEASASNLLHPPTQPAKKLPPSHSQSALPLSKATQQDSSTPLLRQTHALLPLQQQNPHWYSVENITARPKWTLEPPPPPGLQPAFEGKGDDRGLKATGEGSQVAVPLREKLGEGGSRLGDGWREGSGRPGESSAGDEGRGVYGGDEERRLGELRANVAERGNVADMTACRKGKVSDGTRVGTEDGTRDSGPDGNASSTSTHISAPDAVAASEEHENEERNQQTDAPQRDNDTTTPLNPQDQPIRATDPRIDPSTITTNPPRRSPTNNRTFSNARDEIASLKRGRKDTSSPSSSSSYSSSPPNSASSFQPPLKKKKKEKEPRGNQSPFVSRPVEGTSEQGAPEESNPEGRNNDYVLAPVPADQESRVSTAGCDPQALDLPLEKSGSDGFPSGSLPFTSKLKGTDEEEEEEEKRQEKEKEKEKENEIENEKAKADKKEKEPTKKRKRPPRPTMSKRELSNLEGTTVEGKLRRRGREGQETPPQREQEQKQEQKERKGLKEGKGKGSGKGEQKERKGEEIPVNGDGVAGRKRQKRS